ncbi:hypothetical protein [Sutcliffiella rhizosphaerae]|uniref:Uncharacterized protein n=1 Tax=Sutcliffiella rhizosphaerae TaxID=2880967 RepID=A0ABN8AC97_9BACI|nr:hypothetical protein [Sutcliffiella rhizosphaerae]CAG9621576.1 hypothetical protein BACCIP111883_02349 [Sutcliffiella rhizosphaerae]
MGEYILKTEKLVKVFGESGGDGSTTAVDGLNLEFHSSNVRKADRKQFLNQFMDNLVVLGGRVRDV